MKSLLDSFNEKLNNKSTKEIIQLIRDYREYVTSGVHPENSTYRKMTSEICDLYGAEYNNDIGRSTLEYQVYERFLDTHDQAYKAKKKEKNRLATLKQRFAEHKKENPKHCYCAYDEHGDLNLHNQKVDWDDPIDFYKGIYKCLVCGIEDEFEFPTIKRDRTTDDSTFSTKNYNYLDDKFNKYEVSKSQPDYDKTFFYSGHNNKQWLGYWGDNITYALFDSFGEFYGLGKFVGLRRIEVGPPAGGAPSFFESGFWEPYYYDAPVFRFIEDLGFIVHCNAVPAHLFPTIPPLLFNKYDRYSKH